MNITLYNMTSAKNVINKTMAVITSLQGSLRNECSRTNPIVRIEADISSLNTANYLYIQEFSRYYYIEDITSIRNGICDIQARVDVLESFKDSILNEPVIIRRQRDNWNLYINDGSFISYENDLMYNVNFPTAIDGLSYVLATS